MIVRIYQYYLTSQQFPSPTGVNYYEYTLNLLEQRDALLNSFRPQQGLTIMNNTHLKIRRTKSMKKLFPSPTGVNYYELVSVKQKIITLNKSVFPSPTGVNYYEFFKCKKNKCKKIMRFRPQQGLTIMNYS